VTNNPKLLEMVEDTIKRMILPEINQIREDQVKDSRHSSTFYKPSDMNGFDQRIIQPLGTPRSVNRPKVVLNRDGGLEDYPMPRRTSRAREKLARHGPRESVDAPAFVHSGASTPKSETLEEWYEQQRKVNERYRDELDAGQIGSLDKSLTSQNTKHEGS
jgi:hypothetical protein